MAVPKEEQRGVIEGYFYACCPYCRTTLNQSKNGTDHFYYMSAMRALYLRRNRK